MVCHAIFFLGAIFDLCSLFQTHNPFLLSLARHSNSKGISCLVLGLEWIETKEMARKVGAICSTPSPQHPEIRLLKLSKKGTHLGRLI